MKVLYSLITVISVISNGFIVTKWSQSSPNRLFGLPIRNPFGLNSLRKYPLSKNHHERYIKRLNSKNITLQNNEIISGNNSYWNMDNDKE